MPDYGLSSDATGLLPWSWAVDQLDAARRFWVATVDPSGQPHVSAVWAVWFADALWFSCGPRSRKARNLLMDSRCSVATERADEAVSLTGQAVSVGLDDLAMASVTAVDGVDGVAEPGVAELAGTDVARVTDAYVAKYGEGFPDPAVNPLFAVLPDIVIGMVEADFSNRATRWTFADHVSDTG